MGLSQRQALRHVLLPQTFGRILPTLGNDLISLLKDSSLVSVLGAIVVGSVGGWQFWEWRQRQPKPVTATAEAVLRRPQSLQMTRQRHH